MKKKTLALLLALVLVFGAAVGGTIAYLTDKTAEVKNTFTVGNISISLSETTPENKQAKIIPGCDIAKDPKVTVVANSETCWLFVKVEEANWPTPTETVGGNTVRKVNYAIADGWTALEGQTGVYYRSVNADASNDQYFYVLKGDDTHTNGVVTVSENLTKTEVSGISTSPTLAFTAYACQKSGFDTAAAAWTEVSK